MAEFDDRPTGEPPVVQSIRRISRIAVWTVVGLLAARAACEVGMMLEYGNDAQMSIWAFALVIKLALWLLGGLLAIGVLRFVWSRRWARPIGLTLLAAWAILIVGSSWDYNAARRALADARNSATAPERLRELSHFAGVQSGYELDNRLAANPGTPADVLRELSTRVDQAGTQNLLAKNPRTPADARPKPTH